MSITLHKHKLLIGAAVSAAIVISAGFLFQFRQELFQSNVLPSSGTALTLSKEKPLVGMYYYPGWTNEGGAWNSTYNLKKSNPEREYVTGWEDAGTESFMNKEVTWAKDHGIDYIWLEQYEDPAAQPTFSTERNNYALKNFKKVNNNRLKFNLVWANHDINTNGYTLDELARYANYWNTEYFSDPNYLKTPDGKNIIVFWSTGALKTNFTNAMKKRFTDALVAKAKAGTLNTALNGTSCGAYTASTATTWGNCLFTNQMTLIQSSHTDLASADFSTETKACGAYPTTGNGSWTSCLVKSYFAGLKTTYNAYIFQITDDFSTTNLTNMKTLGIDAGTGWSHFNVNIGGPALFTRYKETVASIYATLANTSTSTSIPYFPTVQVGRNMEPWSYSSRTQFLDDTPEQFREVLELAGRFLLKKKADLPFQMLTIQSWNEMGEGAYLMPTKKWGFGKLEAVQDFKNCMYGLPECSRTQGKSLPSQSNSTNTNQNQIAAVSNSNTSNNNTNTSLPTNTPGNANGNTISQTNQNTANVNANTPQGNQNSNNTNTNLNAAITNNNQNTLTQKNSNQILGNTTTATPTTTAPSSSGSSSGGAVSIPNTQQNTNATTVLPSAPLFTDIGTHFAKTYITDLYNKGIIAGRTPTTFVPNGTLNRAEAAKLIITASVGLSEADTYMSTFTIRNPRYNYMWFPDVAIQSWYAKYVGLAKDKGIFTGTHEGLFEPARNITRAEFVKIISQAFFPPLKSPSTNPFPDVYAQAWYSSYVTSALEKGIIDHNTLFRPDAPITRGEAAKILSIALTKKQ